MAAKKSIEHCAADPSVAVIYLARGRGADYAENFRRFRISYAENYAGLDHRLYIIFKGFDDHQARKEAQDIFANIDFFPIEADDARFDIGAYIDALPMISEEIVCFLNTYSEIASRCWLAKLIGNLRSSGVGLVGATGTYESLHTLNREFPGFPNPHLRTNAVAMRRHHAASILATYTIKNKLDTFFIESGSDSLTRRILSLGLTCLIVGADGRGYAPHQWPQSGTYRLGSQENLLVHDNYTREFTALAPDEKMILAAASWGCGVSPSVFELDAGR